MKKGDFVLVAGAALVAIALSRRQDPYAGMTTTQISNEIALNSPAAQEAYANIESVYGSDFTNQLQDAVNTYDTAGEVWAALQDPTRYMNANEVVAYNASPQAREIIADPLFITQSGVSFDPNTAEYYALPTNPTQRANADIKQLNFYIDRARRWANDGPAAFEDAVQQLNAWVSSSPWMLKYVPLDLRR